MAEHEINDTGNNIILTDCDVREIYTSDEQLWRPTKRRFKVKEFSDSYIAHTFKEGY